MTTVWDFRSRSRIGRYNRFDSFSSAHLATSFSTAYCAVEYNHYVALVARDPSPNVFISVADGLLNRPVTNAYLILYSSCREGRLSTCPIASLVRGPPRFFFISRHSSAEASHGRSNSPQFRLNEGPCSLHRPSSAALGLRQSLCTIFAWRKR